MSIDYATGSRLNLNDDIASLPLRSGTSTLAYCPRFDPASFYDSPGALRIPGTGSPNRPPDAIVAFMNAASFRVNVEISGNGQSASFNEVIELGMTEQRGDVTTSDGEPITSLASRWQWATFELDPQVPRVPFATTRLQVFNEVGEGQEFLQFFPFSSNEASFTSVAYNIEDDFWSLLFTFLVAVNDGDVGGDSAIAQFSPTGIVEGEEVSTGFTLMGFECPLRLSEGASVSGSITAESYLTRY